MVGQESDLANANMKSVELRAELDDLRSAVKKLDVITHMRAHARFLRLLILPSSLLLIGPACLIDHSHQRQTCTPSERTRNSKTPPRKWPPPPPVAFPASCTDNSGTQPAGACKPAKTVHSNTETCLPIGAFSVTAILSESHYCILFGDQTSNIGRCGKFRSIGRGIRIRFLCNNTPLPPLCACQ